MRNSSHRAKPVTVDGVDYPSRQTAAVANGKDHSGVLATAKLHGVPFEVACSKFFQPLPIKFRGHGYPTKKAACVAFGVSYSAVLLRCKDGMSFEDGLEDAIRAKARKQVTYRGKTYPSRAALCRSFGISYDVVNDQINRHPALSFDENIDAVRRRASKDGRLVAAKKKRPTPILFGWRFRSWKAAIEYWRPFPDMPSAHKLMAIIDQHGEIDLVMKHAIDWHLERGNVTKDFRRVDEAEKVSPFHIPVERVEAFTRYGLDRVAAEGVDP